MKKAMVVLVLLGLGAGLAQAQTAQVKLLWEKKFPDWPGHFALDVVNGKPVAIIGYAGSARMIDESGKETIIPNMQGYSQVHLSAHGRSGIGRWHATPEPKGFAQSGITALGRDGRKGGFYRDEDPYLNPGSILITDDGERIAVVKGGREGSGDNIWNAPDDTIFLFNRAGGIVAKIAAPYLRSMVLSEKDHRLFFVQQPFEIQGKYRDAKIVNHETVLKCCDQNGRELWREVSPVKYPWPGHTGDLAVDSLGRLCHIVWSERHKGYVVAFYNLTGVREKEVKLPPPLDKTPTEYDYRSRTPSLVVSPDGERAVLTGGQYVYSIDRDSARILCRFHRPASMIWSPVMLDDNITAVAVWEYDGTERRDVGHIYVLDASGKRVWRSEEAFTTTYLRGFRKWFLALHGGKTFRLFEIVK